MDIGINLPWGDYGKDFGLLPSTLPNKDWRTLIPNHAQELNNLKINIIRMFILADGQLCDPPPDQNDRIPNPATAQPDIIASIQPQFMTHFEDLLKLIQRNGFKLIPVFIDHHFCFKEPPAKRVDSGRVKGGRFDILNDSTLRTRFLNKVLQDLVNISVKYRDVIYAWELINEPELCTKLTGSSAPQQNVELESMKAFIREGNAIINPPGSASTFATTVGFQFRSSIEPALRHINPFIKNPWNVTQLGLTKYQFHYYGYLEIGKGKEKLSKLKVSPSTECFIGEIGTEPNPLGRIPPGDDHTWPDPGSAQDIESKLKEVQDKKYPLVLLWSLNADDPDSLWDQTLKTQNLVDHFNTHFKK